TGDSAWRSTPMHGFIAPENSRFTSGPAAAGQAPGTSAERGRVTYWCGNQNEVATSPPILDRTCFRSLDGGATWQRRSILFTTVAPVTHPECAPNSETFSAGDGNYPQAGPDGSLWVMVQCGSTTYVAKSTDEAATFPILEDPVTGPYAI